MYGKNLAFEIVDVLFGVLQKKHAILLIPFIRNSPLTK